MIRSFGDRRTELLWQRRKSKDLDPRILKVALRKLVQLDAAVSLDSLRVPPGNRMEALSGDRKGQHSIRVNNQWRVCFEWRDGGADNVEVVDYH